LRVVTVLRTGKGFKPAHVQALHRQVRKWLPAAETVCLTDEKSIAGEETLPLQYDWPGWWAKMELFRPDIEGDLLFMDLDTIVVGALDEIAAVQKLTVLRDFYRPHAIQSSIMFITEKDRAEIWENWMRSPDSAIAHQRHGDQGFLERFWHEKAARWQDVLPGKIVSYKADVRKAGEVVPKDASVIAFHGKPRPWDLSKEHYLHAVAGY
jgi:hypothetical protein